MNATGNMVRVPHNHFFQISMSVMQFYQGIFPSFVYCETTWRGCKGWQPYCIATINLNLNLISVLEKIVLGEILSKNIFVLMMIKELWDGDLKAEIFRYLYSPAIWVGLEFWKIKNFSVYWPICTLNCRARKYSCIFLSCILFLPPLLVTANPGNFKLSK